jgi:hypothetical protein
LEVELYVVREAARVSAAGEAAAAWAGFFNGQRATSSVGLAT